MSSEGTLAVAAMVVALVQLGKWAGIRDSWAPLLVILLSVIGVILWLVSGESWPPTRYDIWPILTGIIAVTLSSAGTFGFTRAGAAAVTQLKSPPAGGAGSDPSIKSGDIPVPNGGPDPVTAPSVDTDTLADEIIERIEARMRATNTESTDRIQIPPTGKESR